MGTQYKAVIFKKKLNLSEWGKVGHSKNIHMARHFIVLPEECPQSVIVHNGIPLAEVNWKAMAKEIYSKYVKEGSPYQIDVEYQSRKDLSDLMDSIINPWS